jgi:hypothetical protein
MQHFATEAESILGQLQGMEPGEGNTILPGHDTPVTLIYGSSRVFVDDLGAGFRKRTVTPATMTRTQGLPAPALRSIIIRTDQTPPVKYVVHDVDTTDPIDFKITLVAHGV